MQGNIISLICNSCGCGQTEAQEYLDSEIRYLRELQEADDLREDDMETASGKPTILNPMAKRMPTHKAINDC
ncbi:hypothetical protein AAH158_16620, partial [Parabacteroides merdae]|uniref:hypothetical protein n=1 Tax=Parabacteroides merdae TaxID=46503 RepID=UPI0039B492EA